jgi:hypothetical protein
VQAVDVVVCNTLQVVSYIYVLARSHHEEVRSCNSNP